MLLRVGVCLELKSRTSFGLKLSLCLFGSRFNEVDDILASFFHFAPPGYQEEIGKYG
jgi:hypothetical protein